MDNRRSLRETLSRDETFHLLQSELRRSTLRYLDAAEGTVSLEDLLTGLVARQADGEPNPETCERVATELVHVHLPKLAEVGVVEYDRDAGEIHLQDGHELLFEHLSLEDAGRPTGTP
jgi:hypothetical protein